MRMWMIDPKKLCRKHLLGEHVEIHMMVGSLIKGRSIAGFLDQGILEPQHAEVRHQALAVEVQARGYKHSSPLPAFRWVTKGKVSLIKSEHDLKSRCPDCANRIKETTDGKV